MLNGAKLMIKVNFEWVPKKSGHYTFEFQSIDRDLNYSNQLKMLIF